jgi:predicted DNA binding CopG/RHH family protein
MPVQEFGSTAAADDDDDNNIRRLCLSSAENRAKRRIALRRLFATNVAHMSDGTHLTTWVTRETKERFAAVARHQGLSDSALLKRLVDLMLQSASAAEVRTPGGADLASRDSRLTVRIRPDDRLLLRERAAARGMATATYVSVLTRSHLRSLAPLPKAEWLILERILTELGKLGRNINQIARAANRGERVSDPGSTQFRAMLAICNALRVNTKKLLQANAKSWEQGYEDQK